MTSQEKWMVEPSNSSTQDSDGNHEKPTMSTGDHFGIFSRAWARILLLQDKIHESDDKGDSREGRKYSYATLSFLQTRIHLTGK